MDEDSISQNQLDDLFLEMIAFYQGDVKRIQHFTKVHSFARLIGKMEEMAKNYGKNVEDINGNESLKSYIKEGIESEKAIEFIVKNAKFKK